MEKYVNSNEELEKWGPIDGKPIYIDPFCDAFEAYPAFIGHSWPSLIGYFENDRITFIWNKQKMLDRGGKLFNELGKSKEERKKAFDKWYDSVGKIKEMEEVVNNGLADFDEEKLTSLYKTWDKIHLNFWLTGFLPELSNYGGEEILRKAIRGRYPDEVLEKLTTPEKLSFFQTEERELLEIALLNDSEKNYRLAEHQQNYYWLRNNYGYTKVLPIEYFAEELAKIGPDEAKVKIKKIDQYSKCVFEDKNKVIAKYSITDEVTELTNKFSEYIWWQDYRKKFIFIANHIITRFAEEVAKRKGIPIQEIYYYREREIINLLENGQKIDVEKRFKAFVVKFEAEGKISFLEGDMAKKFIEPFLQIKLKENIDEFKGNVVSRGENLKGKVKILLTPSEVNELEEGNILVAPMTSPDYIVAMRKAGAVVTDEGGLMSHAAIVSRELGIPCLVGTKIATKVLKDGDLVEVDADKGVVRILERS